MKRAVKLTLLRAIRRRFPGSLDSPVSRFPRHSPETNAARSARGKATETLISMPTLLNPLGKIHYDCLEARFRGLSPSFLSRVTRDTPKHPGRAFQDCPYIQLLTRCKEKFLITTGEVFSSEVLSADSPP